MRSSNAKNLGRAAGIMVGLVWALSGSAVVAQETAPTDYEVAALAPKAGEADAPKSAPAGHSGGAEALANDNDPHSKEVYSKNVERVKRIKSLFGKLKQQVDTADTAQQQVSNLPKELPPEAMEIDEEPMPGQGASVLDEAPPAPKAKKDKKSKKSGKTAVASAEKHYKVKKGDTLAKIAKKLLGSTKKANLIAKANGLTAGASLKPGRELVIPGSSHIADSDLGDVAVGEPEAPTKVAKKDKKEKKKGPSPKNPNSEPVLDYSNYEFSMYTVKAGDTIGKISKAFYDNGGGGGDLIRRYNKLGKGDNLALKPGEKLLIPLPKQKKSDDRYEKAKKGIF
jgi:nucleoid-associated protein YgaU